MRARVKLLVPDLVDAGASQAFHCRRPTIVKSVYGLPR
jgi:hypothetical protein